MARAYVCMYENIIVPPLPPPPPPPPSLSLNGFSELQKQAIPNIASLFSI